MPQFADDGSARSRTTHASVPVGTISARHGTWSWSDAVFAIHGFEPGEIVPTAAVMLAHCHPADRAVLSVVLDEGGNAMDDVAEQYRLIDALGREHWVALAVERRPSEALMVGKILDLTSRHSTASAQAVNAMLATALESRSVIDRAKGAIQLVYGTDDNTAFDLLKWYSQQTNVKLRALADNIVDSLGRSQALPPSVKRALDEVFLDLSASGQDRTRPPDRHVRAPRTVAELDVHVEADAVMVVVVGDVDLSTAPALAATLRSACERVRRHRPLVIDLTACVHLGPAGLAELAAARRRLAASGGTIHALIGDEMPNRGAIAAVVDTAVVPSHVPADAELRSPRTAGAPLGGAPIG